MPVLGLDTSNYTTSAAIFDGERGRNVGRLLDVRPGELGLRQSDALFQHIKRLPEMVRSRCGGIRPAQRGGGFLYALFFGRRGPGPGDCRGSGSPLLCPLPPARASGRRRLVRRAGGAAGRPLPGLASVRRHDRTAACKAKGLCGGG